MGLFGDASPENKAKVAHGSAVIACFTRGAGTVFNAGSADWCYGLDHDPLVQQVTHNVLTCLKPLNRALTCETDGGFNRWVQRGG